MHELEIEFLLFLQALRGDAHELVNTFFLVVSALAVSPLPILLGAILLWCVDKRFGYLVSTNFVVGSSVNQVLKSIACIYRPWIIDERIVPHSSALPDATSYSFPSGHTAIATSVFGSIAVGARKHKAIVVLCVIFILLVAFSRTWLGCHAPKDVVVAILLSAAMVAVVCWVMRLVDKHPSWDVVIAAIVFVLGVAAFMYCATKSYPIEYAADGSVLVDPYEMQTDSYKNLGAFIAMPIAWIVERRFIQFSIEGSVKTKVIRGIVGTVFVGLLYVVILPTCLDMFLDDHWSHFVKYFILVFLVLDVYPLMFKAFEGRTVK